MQFAFVVTCHIIFPSFTIGIAAWLAALDGASIVTGRRVFDCVFDFWLKVLAVSFGMGVVTGILVGHRTGELVREHQSAKFAAIEARWKTEQPGTEVLFAIPDESQERNRLSIEIPKLGSFVATGTWDSREVGLEEFPKEDRPPVAIPFFTFGQTVVLKDHQGVAC